jgi:stage II sporulation protein D
MNRWAAVVLCTVPLALPAQDWRREEEVRIGVLGLFHPTTLVIRKIPGQALECGMPGQRHAIANELRLNAADLSPQKPPYWCDDGAGGETAFSLSVPGRITRRYRGKLRLHARAEQIITVVTMKLEAAVASVVAAESPGDAPLEALKAQAVAARSFLVAGKGIHKDFDFCDTTHCQFLRSAPREGSPAAQAAIETQGVVLSYGGARFAAMYSASCSGKTHSLDELGIPIHGYPYFPVVCDYCRRHPQKWSARLSRQEAAVLSGTESSRLKLARKLGWSSVRSNFYDTEQEGGEVVLHGAGVGHGLGLCQRGAADMARRGASFADILAHYYPNTSLQQWR